MSRCDHLHHLDTVFEVPPGTCVTCDCHCGNSGLAHLRELVGLAYRSWEFWELSGEGDGQEEGWSKAGVGMASSENHRPYPAHRHALFVSQHLETLLIG